MKIGVDYIGVSAGAVISDADGRYFLARRGQAARDDVGLWEFPGGTVEFYETREAAVVRNVREKYGLDVEVEKLLGVYDVIDKSNKDHWLSTTYICHPVGGEARIVEPEKCIEIGWFKIAQVNQLPLSRISRLNLGDLNLKAT